MAKFPNEDEPHQVLMMIDEFRQLGRMDALVSKLSINAGYGFRMVLVLQDLGQLDEVYSKPIRMTTLSACQVKLFIQINDQDTAEYVSELLGDTTIEIRTPLPRHGQSVFSSAKSVRYEERAFRTPQQLRQMNPAKSILLVPNSYGFELTKYRYFADAPFKRLFTGARKLKLKLPRIDAWQDNESDPVVRPTATTRLASQITDKTSLNPAHLEANAIAFEHGEKRRQGPNAAPPDLLLQPASTTPSDLTATASDAVAKASDAEIQQTRRGQREAAPGMATPTDGQITEELLGGGGIDDAIARVEVAIRAQKVDFKRLKGQSRSVDDFITLHEQSLEATPAS